MDFQPGHQTESCRKASGIALDVQQSRANHVHDLSLTNR